MLSVLICAGVARQGARGASAAAEAAGREGRARAAPPLSRRLGPPRPALLLLLRAFCWRSSPLRPLVRVGGCECSDLGLCRRILSAC
eukprot:2964921-Rhodomonas_salina.2